MVYEADAWEVSNVAMKELKMFPQITEETEENLLNLEDEPPKSPYSSTPPPPALNTSSSSSSDSPPPPGSPTDEQQQKARNQKRPFEVSNRFECCIIPPQNE
ncbi:hypothetical protein CDAR_26872 [Caerostris darwini]|uniref:Uncharacterized protein n=1 Tax=Caerostris darwini TaxID=1538125 RepID=A0AAV4WVC0_9ARAC|nr:hypothetical protein CDAR_26872 [Caerostris darwini]